MKRLNIYLLTACLLCSPSGMTQKRYSKGKTQYHKHYIDIYAGGGVSSLGYFLGGGDTQITPSFNAGVGYTYYFLPWMGLQTGLSISRYGTTARLIDDMQWQGLTDYQNDIYNHRISFDNWKERERLYLFEVPVGLRFQPLKNKAGLYAAVGIKAGIPVLADYRHKEGSIEHYAWYPRWQLELHDLPGRFETETVEIPQEDSFRQYLSKIDVLVYAEIGFAVRTSERADIYLAAYGQYGINNFIGSTKEPQPLGFANTYLHTDEFMAPYLGLIGTDHVGALHPWAAGLKLGVSIYPGLTKAQRKRQAKRLSREFPELMPKVRDTLLLTDTLWLHDTIYIRENKQVNPQPAAAKQERPTAEEKRLAAMLTQAVIWFHFDKYEPIVEPAYILDSVASMMQRYPELTIHVNGHACIIGKDGYNQRLAMKRAQAVADLLQEKGISQDRMRVVSYGASHPYRYNTQHQLSIDRRVEIVPEGYELQPKEQQLTAINQAPAYDSKKETIKPAYEQYNEFIGEEIVRTGSRLAQIARRWYGVPQYWVYIYEANADKIKDFSNVHPGLVVMIPDLKNIHKNLNDKQALEHAKKLENQYLNRTKGQ